MVVAALKTGPSDTGNKRFIRLRQGLRARVGFAILLGFMTRKKY
jgi:hypothetical protein